MRVDYHVHSPYCGHARGRMIEYVERAVALRLDEIGFADHLGRYYLSAPQRARYADWGMAEGALERYVREIEDLRALFAGAIDIRIGLEIDFVRGAEKHLAPLLARYPLDFALGSVHCLPRFGWRHLTCYTTRPARELYREYFAMARDAVCSGLFDSLAHVDFLWRYVPVGGVLAEEARRQIRALAGLAKERDTALEMNANGFLWSELAGKRGPRLFERLVTEIAAHGAAVTLGSDAHTPQAVGSALEQLAGYLARHGVHHCATFSRRLRTLVALG